METKKVIEEFTKRGKTVEIDGERAPELVFGDLKPHFDKLIQ